MNRHNGYTTKPGEAQCTKCEEWIAYGEESVIMEPVTVGDRGVEHKATAIHGILCMDCYDSL